MLFLRIKIKLLTNGGLDLKKRDERIMEIFLRGIVVASYLAVENFSFNSLARVERFSFFLPPPSREFNKL